MCIRDSVYPADLQSNLEHTRQLLAGAMTTYIQEQRYIRKDGSLVWVSTATSLVQKLDRAPDCINTIVEDITQRRLAQQKLADERNLLRTIIDNVPDYIYVK